MEHLTSYSATLLLTKRDDLALLPKVIPGVDLILQSQKLLAIFCINTILRIDIEKAYAKLFFFIIVEESYTIAKKYDWLSQII